MRWFFPPLLNLINPTGQLAVFKGFLSQNAKKLSQTFSLIVTTGTCKEEFPGTGLQVSPFLISLCVCRNKGGKKKKTAPRANQSNCNHTIKTRAEHGMVLPSHHLNFFYTFPWTVLSALPPDVLSCAKQ